MASDFETEWERPEFDSVPSLAVNAVYLLAGCDDRVLRKTLQEVYRDFCRRSAALRTWRRIELEEGETRYPVVPVLSGEIDCVTDARFARSRLPFRGWRVEGDPPVLRVDRRFVERGFTDSPGVAYVPAGPNMGVVQVTADGSADAAPPAAPTALWVEAVEVPHLNEERAPRQFLRRYGDALVDGALARMYSMANRAWSDGEQARQRGIAYANALSEARMRSQRGGPAANAGAVLAVDMSGMV